MGCLIKHRIMDTLDNTVYNDPVSGGQLPPDVEMQMKATTPWMKFIAILGFVGLFIMVAISITTMVISPQPQTMGMFAGYLIGAVVLFFPLLFLVQSASSFNGYLEKRDHHELVRAFSKQKAYWRYMGIFMIVYLVIVIAGIIFGLLAARSAMM